MFQVKLCLGAWAPIRIKHRFFPKVLSGTVEEICRMARDWGYDGIEYRPDPEYIPDPRVFAHALSESGVEMPVVNSGVMVNQGMALIHEDEIIRKRSIEGFKNMLSFAGYFEAGVVLGAVRGLSISWSSKETREQLVEEVFQELAMHAEKVGAVIMLEAAT